MHTETLHGSAVGPAFPSDLDFAPEIGDVLKLEPPPAPTSPSLPLLASFLRHAVNLLMAGDAGAADRGWSALLTLGSSGQAVYNL